AAEQQLFRNQGNANHWIELDLEGVTSTRDGVGAIIYATTPDGRVQLREQNHGVHRYVQDAVRTHFGLAGNTAVELEVHWPSGIVDTFARLPVDHIHRLVEGSGDRAPVCGTPVYAAATESVILLYNDCGTNRWHVRATAGGQFVTYRGGLIADQPFASLTGFSFEFGDLLPPPNYVMSVGGIWQDGLDFTLATGAKACFSLTAPVNKVILAGATRLPVGTAVSLPDFGLCTTSPAVPSAANLSVIEAAGTAMFNVTLTPAASSDQ
ncbi:ASPIC/UnbV domain-containing protein, partial [uncultured Lamprocystis sp.]